MNVKKSLWTIVALLIILLSACQPGGAPETQTPGMQQQAEVRPIVSATGKIVPQQETVLSVTTGGVVAEVLVHEGDSVEEGQLLVKLQGKEQLQAAISAAEFELVSAEKDLEALDKDTDLIAAQSLRAAEEAERALEDLRTPELQDALALQAIADAQKAVDSAERRARILKTTADQATIDEAKAQLVFAKDALDKARDDYEPYANKPEDNLARANLLIKFSAAQQRYDAAVRKLNALQGTANDVDISVAEAELATAKAQLIEAQRDWERVQDGPNPGDIALLEAQIKTSQKDYEIYSQGPDPDEVTLAQARVANAKDQLAAAEAALRDLELRAPFSGVVSRLNVQPSQWIAMGQPVLVLAKLEEMQIETTDLNEIDVARVNVGDTAILTFDALPEVEMEGEVVRIAPMAAEGSGVNYTVVVSAADIPERLRWGMTAFVDIQVQD
jgi:HlyD family secretion protein